MCLLVCLGHHHVVLKQLFSERGPGRICYHKPQQHVDELWEVGPKDKQAFEVLSTTLRISYFSSQEQMLYLNTTEPLLVMG
ncbi:hypothetical protein EYF80_019858 [Liparis tanakae]|uniref:Uncharacterized protein n=1 Tax=Liparis tanakae TaxID=230148 RepID=A0A4Z2HXC0_9TELE|nr:hypothetical protein EYF80_019858 [Liparis tanakae]